MLKHKDEDSTFSVESSLFTANQVERIVLHVLVVNLLHTRFL